VSRLTEKQLLIITIAISVLLTGGLGFLIWSDLQAIEEEEGRIGDLQTQIQAAEGEIAQIPQREHRVIANREISEREVAFLPEASEIENFWNVLWRYAEESGVKISEITPNRINTRSKNKSSIQSMPQVMSLRGTIDEFLRFINSLENYDRIINVVEYSLKSGESPDTDGQVRHTIKLALTTFTYSKKIASTIVSIPQYEKKREHPEVKKWLSRIKIQERETYTLRSSVGRRDPFKSVRRAPLTDTQAGDDPEKNRPYQEAKLDACVDLLEILRDGLEFQEELQKRGDLWRLQAQIKENRETFSELSSLLEEARKEIVLPDLQERLESEVAEPFEEIKKRMDKLLEQNPPLSLEKVQEAHDRILDHFEEREWEKVEEGVRDFMDASRKGEHVVEEARELVLKIIDMQRSAKVIRAFEKRKIEISTILYAAEGNSVAVINGKQMMEGDALDAGGQVIVIEIGENYVIFETEGVEIKRLQKGK
jgi:Tfp pilus assembly protein PilO